MEMHNEHAATEHEQAGLSSKFAQEPVALSMLKEAHFWSEFVFEMPACCGTPENTGIDLSGIRHVLEDSLHDLSENPLENPGEDQMTDARLEKYKAAFMYSQTQVLGLDEWNSEMMEE